MNLVKLQDTLKNFSQDQLIQEMQMPSGSVPQYLVLSEIMRRQKADQEFQAAQAPQSTVAQDAVNAAGVPQGGLADMAQAMAPQTDVAGNTGAQPIPGMNTGGMIGPSYGSMLEADPAIVAMAQRMGVPVEDYVAMMGSQRRAGELQRNIAARAINTPSLSDIDPRAAQATMALPSQADLDRGAYGREVALSEAPTVPGYSPERSMGMPAEFGRDQSPFRFDVSDPVPNRDATLGMAGANRIGFELGPNDEQFGRFLDGAGVVGRSGRPADEQAMATEILLRDAARQPVSSNAIALPSAVRASDARGTEATRMMEINDPLGERKIPDADGTDLMRRRWAQAEDVGGIDDIYNKDADVALKDRIWGGVKDFGKDFFERLATVSPTMSAQEAKDRLGITAAQFEAEGEVTEGEDAVAKAVEAATETEEAFGTGDVGGGGAGSGGGSGAGGSGGSGLSSFESEILDAIKRRERAAEQDKWLALARVGLQLMASRQPTLGGALGEAGLAGLEGYQEQRDDYEKDRLGLVSALYDARARQAAASARAAGSKAAGMPEPGMSTDMKRLFDADLAMLEMIQNNAAMGTDADKAAALEAQATFQRRWGGYASPGTGASIAMPSAGG